VFLLWGESLVRAPKDEGSFNLRAKTAEGRRPRAACSKLSLRTVLWLCVILLLHFPFSETQAQQQHRHHAGFPDQHPKRWCINLNLHCLLFPPTPVLIHFSKIPLSYRFIRIH
jgi:hypothetical protein